MTITTEMEKLGKTYRTEQVMGKDGTPLNYRQFGQGAGVVIVHGTMSSAHNHLQLAEALANSFTVYVPDRRGRGGSGPFRPAYTIQHEVDDLAAVLNKTGARYVFGVSSGGIIALQAALTLPNIEKVAVFEPPFFVNDAVTPKHALTRFDREMAEGKVADALITAMKAAQMGPPIFNAMPRWLTTRLTKMMLAQEAKKGIGAGEGNYVSMEALAHTLHYDFQLVVEMSGRDSNQSNKLEKFRGVAAEVLLLGGSKSPAYMKEALGALEQILPKVKRVELAGVDHAASWNTDRGGQPVPVAEALREFFG